MTIGCCASAVRVVKLAAAANAARTNGWNECMGLLLELLGCSRPLRDRSGPSLKNGDCNTSMARSIAPGTSERTRHAEHMLRDVRQNQIGRDRRNLVQARLANFPLDVVFVGEAASAVGLHAGVRRFP